MADKPKRKIVKQVENATLYDDGLIVVKNVRLSHPHLGEPYAGTGDDGKPGKPAWSVTGLMPKKTHTEAKNLIRDEIRKLMTENKIKDLPAEKKCLRDGDLAAKDEMEGMWTISAREGKKRPILRDRKNETVETAEADTVFYGGCYGNISISLWFMSNKFGKRVNANLRMVQFVKDGEPFGNSRITEEDADDVFDEMDDDDNGFSDEDEDDDEL